MAESQCCKAAVSWCGSRVRNGQCSATAAKFILVLLRYGNLMFLFDPPPLSCDFVEVFGLLCISSGLVGVVTPLRNKSVFPFVSCCCALFPLLCQNDQEQI